MEIFNISNELNLIDFEKNPSYKLLPEFVKKNFNDLETNLNCTEKSLFICDVLIDYAWEMLNTNIWVFVDELWRYVYAYATLYKICFLIKQEKEKKTNSSVLPSNKDEFREQIIKLCDLG